MTLSAAIFYPGNERNVKRQFSLAALTALGCPPPELTYIAALTGYDMVSLRIIPFGDPQYDLVGDKAMLAATRQALADTGLPVLDVELARILPDVDMAVYVPYLEIAADLGAKHMTTSFWSPDHAYVVEKLGELCDLAKPFGITVNVEFLPFVDIGRLEEQLAIINEAGCDNCGLMIDTLFVDPEFAGRIPRKLLHLVQLADGPKKLPPLGTKEMFDVVRGARLYLGEGEINIAKLVKSLPVLPYSIEICHDARVKTMGYAEHARRCLQTTKRYFAEHIDVTG